MNITVPVTYPSITSYPTYASLLAVTDLYFQSDYENYMNWYMIQFINTIQFESTNYIIFDNTLKENTIEYCEIIEREIYNGVQMQQFGISFFDFLIDLICTLSNQNTLAFDINFQDCLYNFVRLNPMLYHNLALN